MSEHLKQNIKQRSLELGFCDIGIAEAVPLDEEIEHYKEWLSRAYHGKMSYLERNLDKRHDVRNILPGARSVIVLAYNYYCSFQHPPNDELGRDYGKISRYAWNYDYHDIIKPKLKDVASFIEEQAAGKKTWIYVDTGPVMEKAWAQRAGVGWLGKNGTIISKKFGSWILLGIIITTVELPADEPEKDHCGKCTLCIENCPTEAIVEAKVVDSNKCISYWTIETKAEIDIPPAIAKNMNNFIFGCDICQEVCPWNRKKPKPTSDQHFYPRRGETVIPVDEILHMSEENFRERFRKSPVKRPKLSGFRRNAKAMRDHYND